jgi:hypothetical protein
MGPGADEAVEFFAGSPLGRSVLQRVREVLADQHDDVTERVGRSQVAFRRSRGFAFLWRPGQYLTNPAAEVVLSVGLPRRLESARFKEVAHPAPRTWMHHLELHSEAEVDDEVVGWLRDAADAAGPTSRPASRQDGLATGRRGVGGQLAGPVTRGHDASLGRGELVARPVEEGPGGGSAGPDHPVELVELEEPDAHR